MADFSRAPDYFVVWGWGLDLRHVSPRLTDSAVRTGSLIATVLMQMNARGHRALGDLISSFALEQWDVATRQLETASEFDLPSWREPSGLSRPGYTKHWPSLDHLGDVPKVRQNVSSSSSTAVESFRPQLRLFGPFSPSKESLPFNPRCMTMIQDEWSTDPLEKAILSSDGW